MENDLNSNTLDHNVSQALTSIIGVAIVYFILAIISIQISSITNFSQLLSLHSGFALAAMLAMACWRVLVGIALGALLLNFFQAGGQDGWSIEHSWFIVLSVTAIAIQACIGLKIYRKWVSIDNSLSHDKDLLRFLKVIPVIALVNTVFSMFLSQWSDAPTQDLFIPIEIKLWIGHVTGLILVIPVVLSLVEHKNALWKMRKSIIVSNFIAALVITFLVCSSIKTFESDRLEDRFNILTNQTRTLFLVSLKEKELLQASVAQMIVSQKDLTRDKFSSYVRGLSEDSQYIQVVEWLPKIKYHQRADYEKQQAEHFGEGFTITEAKSKGVIIPATKRDTYYPITYLEPEWDNDLAKGFDPSASLAGKALIKKAIITGKSQARGPVEIARNSGFKHAFIVYKPVYQNFDGTKTLDPSEGEVLGFVNVVVRVEDFISTIVGPKDTANFQLQWQDVESGKYYYGKEMDVTSPFKRVIDIHLTGRDMKLIFTPTASFINQTATEVVAIAMISSFVLSSLFSLLVLNITARTSRIKSEVKIRTKELENVNKQLELLSNKDALTDLFNRRYFENALRDEFERSQRYNSSFALIMFDIDHFKNINDQYGHPCGDKVIKAVADYLIHTSRSSDVLARVGGEEFSVILPSQTETHVMSIVERMRVDLSNIEVKYDDHSVRFTCSFGIAIFDDNVTDIHQLIRMADQAMYKAKNAGRNNTKLFSEHW